MEELEEERKKKSTAKRERETKGERKLRIYKLLSWANKRDVPECQCLPALFLSAGTRATV